MRHIAAVALLTCSSFGKERALLLRFVRLIAPFSLLLRLGLSLGLRPLSAFTTSFCGECGRGWLSTAALASLSLLLETLKFTLSQLLVMGVRAT